MSLYPLSRPCPKCGAKPHELCSNTPAQPCDERWEQPDMTDHDAREALRIAEVTLRLDGERMRKREMSTAQNESALALVQAVLASLPAPTPAAGEAVAWQRRKKYALAGDPPGKQYQWESCSRQEATGHFEKQPGYEYRALYAAPQPPAPADVGGNPCVGCEGNPAPENNPCAVCGLKIVGIANHSPDAGGVGEVELREFASLMVDEVIAKVRIQLDEGQPLALADQKHMLAQLIKERERNSALRPGLRARQE